MLLAVFFLFLSQAHCNVIGILFGTGTKDQLALDFTNSKAQPNKYFNHYGQLPEISLSGLGLAVNKTDRPNYVVSQFYIKYGSVSFSAQATKGDATTVMSLASVYCGFGLGVDGLSPDTVVPYFNGSAVTSEKVKLSEDLTAGYHEYSFDWDAEKVVYKVDKKTVKTLTSSQVNSGYYDDPATLNFAVSQHGLADDSGVGSLKSISLKDATGAYFYTQREPNGYFKSRVLDYGEANPVSTNPIDLLSFKSTPVEQKRQLATTLSEVILPSTYIEV